MRGAVLIAGCLLLTAQMPGSCQEWGLEDLEGRQGWRIQAGWYQMGEAGEGLGIGLSRRFSALGQQWVAGLEWGDAEITHPGPPPVGDSARLWALTWSWVRQEYPPEKTYTWYWGGGVGWYSLRNGGSDSGLGLQLLVGMDFSRRWFGEARYVFNTEFDQAPGLDADGLRVAVGYKF